MQQFRVSFCVDLKNKADIFSLSFLCIFIGVVVVHGREHSDPAHQVFMQNPVSLGTRLLLILEHVIAFASNFARVLRKK
jgi:hypothetical protein